jgi:hypothetical protein
VKETISASVQPVMVASAACAAASLTSVPALTPEMMSYRVWIAEAGGAAVNRRVSYSVMSSGVRQMAA